MFLCLSKSLRVRAVMMIVNQKWYARVIVCVHIVKLVLLPRSGDPDGF